MPTSYEINALNPLVGYGIDYMNQEMGEFVAGLVAPPVPMPIDKGHYPVFDPEDGMQPDLLKPRARSAPAARVKQNLSEDTYECQAFDSAVPYDWRDLQLKRLGPSFPDFERHVTRTNMRNSLLKWEHLFATRVFTEANWAAASIWTGVAGAPSTNEFKRFDESGSNVIDTMLQIRDYIFNRTAYRATDIISTPDVARYLVAKDTKLDGRFAAIKVDRTYDDLAALFKVKRFSVMTASRLTSNLGQTARTFENFATNTMVMLFSDPTPSEYAVTAVRTFAANDGIYKNGVYARAWDDDNIRSTVYEAGVCVDVKITAASLAVFIKTPLTTP